MEKCEICFAEFENKSSLSGHIAAKHKIKMEDYIIKFSLNGNIPSCEICSNRPRFNKTTQKFQKFCTAHANDARKIWAKENKKIKPIKEKIKNKRNTISKEEFEKRLNKINKYKFIGTYNDYIGYTKKTLNFICSACSTEFKTSLSYIIKHKEVCPNCKKDKKVSEQIKKTISNANKLSLREYKKRHGKFFNVLTRYEDYKRQIDQKLMVSCKKCGAETQRTLIQLKAGSVCKKCCSSSSGEREIKDFISSIYDGQIEYNCRSIISPFEIDIYIPEFKIGFEYNGLYWHSEKNKEKDYHQKKSLMAKEKGIAIFHIFEDEWRDKQEIVKSMIRYKIKKSLNKMMARKCVIEKIDKKEEKDFFEKNHISSYARSSFSFGLRFNNELVSMISFRNPLHKKNKTIEICRFANKINTNVAGSFSKLLLFAKNEIIKMGYKEILSYADLRWGFGEVYKNNGFKFEGYSEINYFYTNFKVRYNRFKFRAKDGTSEKEIAKQNKVCKIYSCGNSIFIMPL